MGKKRQHKRGFFAECKPDFYKMITMKAAARDMSKSAYFRFLVRRDRPAGWKEAKSP